MLPMITVTTAKKVMKTIVKPWEKYLERKFDAHFSLGWLYLSLYNFWIDSSDQTSLDRLQNDGSSSDYNSNNLVVSIPTLG